MLTGTCLCGAVAYEVEDAFEYAAICHCPDCRRATGAAAKPFAGITREKLRITRGIDLLLRYGEGIDHDTRCGKCGSLLFSVVREGAYVHVTLGTLTEAPLISPTEHIFAGKKAAWDVIADGLPQYDGHVGTRRLD